MTESVNQKADYILVMTTAPGSITAKKIANELVDKGVAACVQVLPQMYSVFRWKGRVEHEDEHLLLIKTASACYQTVEDIITGQHPYEVPEIVSLPITGGLPDYLVWLEQTAGALES